MHNLESCVIAFATFSCNSVEKKIRNSLFGDVNLPQSAAFLDILEAFICI